MAALEDFQAELDRLDEARLRALAKRDLAFEELASDVEGRVEVSQEWASAFSALADAYEKLAERVREELMAGAVRDGALRHPLMVVGRKCVDRARELRAPVDALPVGQVVHVQAPADRQAEWDAEMQKPGTAGVDWGLLGGPPEGDGDE